MLNEDDSYKDLPEQKDSQSNKNKNFHLQWIFQYWSFSSMLLENTSVENCGISVMFTEGSYIPPISSNRPILLAKVNISI